MVATLLIIGHWNILGIQVPSLMTQIDGVTLRQQIQLNKLYMWILRNCGMLQVQVFFWVKSSTYCVMLLVQWTWSILASDGVKSIYLMYTQYLQLRLLKCWSIRWNIKIIVRGKVKVRVGLLLRLRVRLMVNFMVWLRVGLLLWLRVRLMVNFRVRLMFQLRVG